MLLLIYYCSVEKYAFELLHELNSTNANFRHFNDQNYLVHSKIRVSILTNVKKQTGRYSLFLELGIFGALPMVQDLCISARRKVSDGKVACQKEIE